ncbi:MAG: hypothetical protein U0271_05700 [Polyangiaceae bacterium]
MTITTYDPTMTMKQARDRYFAVNGFGADGGYSDAWADFKLGPIPFPFPNTPARIRALSYHDLHHVLTDYDTDLRGEFEISAWEIGAGCKDFVAAWALNLGGLAGGTMLCPRRTFRAFVRGRRTTSLYGKDVNELLGQSVGEVRAASHIHRSSDPREAREHATAADVVAYGAAVTAGLVIGTLFLGLGSLLAPVGLLANLIRPKKQPAAAV